MTSGSQSTLRITTLAAILLSFATVPAFAQRHRTVTRVGQTEATVTGRVLDAETEQPLEGAHVHIGDEVATTDSEGKFEIEGLHGTTYTVQVSRWAYADSEVSVTLNAGANVRDFLLTATPTTTILLDNGTTHILDTASVRFGHFVAFVGWQSNAELDLCLPSGERVIFVNSGSQSVTFPGTRSETTSCCFLAPGTIARIVLDSGDTVEGTILASCNGREIYVLGRSVVTGDFVHIPVLDVQNVTFP